MAACVDPSVALAFALGRASAAEREEVERRMDECSACRAQVAAAARVAAAEADTLCEPQRRGPARATPSAGLMPGDRVGRYVVERALGMGGMGVVSLANDPELARQVAIKLVRRDLGTQSDAEFEVRLRREAQAMATLSHPNVVRIFDIGRYDERVFLAMEYVAGTTLDAWLSEARRAPAAILALFTQAGAGLAAAHRAGLIHRDFKPTNVLVDLGGVAKVTDFGLARWTTLAEPVSGRAGLPPLASPVASTAAILGTPAYMSPEQRAGGLVDARADQYAFAVTLLDALVGQSPTSRLVEPASSSVAIARALTAAGILPTIRRALVRALAVQPANRFSSMDELVAQLAPRRHVRRWLAVGTMFPAACLAAWLISREGNACAVENSKQFTTATRGEVVAVLSAQPRLFSEWTAERVAVALDAAAGAIMTDKAALCAHRPAPTATCLASRELTLHTVVDAIRRDPSVEPWAMIASIGTCPTGAARGPDEATEGSADAHEHAGLAAFAAFDFASAEQELRAELSAGERTGDDAHRARALVHLLDLERWQGDSESIRRDVNALRALLERHGDQPRDELVVAEAESNAFTDVGDYARAEKAWERRLAAAMAVGLPDALLAARAGRAWARYALQLDLGGARRDAEAALADTVGASADARGQAYAQLGEIALIEGDGSAATAAFANAGNLRPAWARTLAAHISTARARGLIGQVDQALADLRAISSSDSTTSLRIDIARAYVLRDGHRDVEAFELLDRLRKKIVPLLRPDPAFHTPLSERIDAAIAYCEVAGALHKTDSCLEAELLTRSLDGNSAVRGRMLLASAHAPLMPAWAAMRLDAAIPLLLTDHVPLPTIGYAMWDRARTPEGSLLGRRACAIAARIIFAVARYPAEVGAIDGWLAGAGALAPARFR